MKCKDIISEGVSSEKLLETVQNQYIFSVSGGRKDNEFFVTKFRKLDISHTQTAEEPPMPVKKQTHTQTIYNHPKTCSRARINKIFKVSGMAKNNTAQQNSPRKKTSSHQ